MTNDKSCKKSKAGDSDTSIMSDQDAGISVGDVRNDVKHVIETMGNSIPKSIASPRLETDTEEVSTVAASCYSSIVQIREMTVPSDRNAFEPPFDNSALSTNISCESCSVYSVERTNDRIINTPSDMSIRHQSQYPPNVGGCYPNVGYLPQQNYAQGYQIPLQQQAIPQRPSRLATWLGMKTNKRHGCHCDLYKINIDQPTADNSPPRRLVFDLMDDLPKAPTKCKATNTKQKTVAKKSGGFHDHATNAYDGGYPSERVDIYYFDHGNSEFYRTTDISPAIMTEYLAERTERYTKKFWAQIFGTIHIGVAFVIAFLLQLIKFVLQAIVRPLVVGILQVFSDYFLKPFLAVTFNGILQPPMIFLYNWMTSLRDLLHPLAETIGYFVREIAIIFKAIRCFQFRSNNKRFNCKKRTNTKEAGCKQEDK